MTPYPVQKRNYDSIDPVIRKWVSDNSLELYTEYKDVEIRSVWFFDHKGDVRYQIWIDPVDDRGHVDVYVHEVEKLIQDGKKVRPAFSVSEMELRDTLDKTLFTVKSKLGE